MPPDQDESPVFTIGYGSRSFEDLAELLAEHEITCLVDVRTAPYSRFRPEFSKAALEAALPGRGVRYVFLGDALGGRPDMPDCYVDGRVDYERVKEKEFYRRGIERVRRAREQQMRLALMCSEGKPELCHRSRLIGVALAREGIVISHIDADGTLISQPDVILRITGAQLPMIPELAPPLRSRKKYQPTGSE